MSEYSLYDLETAIVRLQEAADDPEGTDESRAQATNDLIEYCRTELLPSKVDGIRQYVRHAELMAGGAREEMQRQAGNAKAWDARLNRVKMATLFAMQEFGKKKLEGKTGYISRRGNGGVQPLTVDESLVPDEFCDKTVTLSVFLWNDVLNALPDALVKRLASDAKESKRMPSNSRVRAALESPCPTCLGLSLSDICEACGGSGKQGVPGAHLEERGESLIVK